MRRRSVLAAWGACFAAIAGCVGDGEPAVDSTPGDPTESSQGHADAQEAFRSAVEQHAVDVQSVELDGTEWTVEYSVGKCCGDPFEFHQAVLARNFSSVRPENVSLTVTTFHECMNIHWRVPDHLARKHRAGEIDTEIYVSHVRNTTSRESQC